MKKADVRKVFDNMMDSYNATSAYAAEKWFLWHEAGIDVDKNERISANYVAKYTELQRHIQALAEVLGVKIISVDFETEYVYPLDKSIKGTLIYPTLEIDWNN